MDENTSAFDAAYTAVATLSRLHLTVSTAESCTGGLIAKLITDVPGASSVFDGSVVSYSNRVKHDILSVTDEILETKGAVSEETAVLMADGVRNLLKTDISVSATGVAGPAGGKPGKPVGTVFVAVSSEKYNHVCRLQLDPSSGRDTIRYETAKCALSLISKATEYYK